MCTYLVTLKAKITSNCEYQAKNCKKCYSEAQREKLLRVKKIYKSKNTENQQK